MAVNEPIWSLGESKLIQSSGDSVSDGDDKWSFGESKLYHEYVEAQVAASMYYFNLLQGRQI